ncbi:coenzyme F420-dependent N5 N10-methylene tetrahydromethanopterin reductase-like protein [Candidatus Protofrankia californiensis]|uniref:Coenzyme F420-dependent N5 N10-methylene tetrahydromethanopterin reductase-like protein n=1 Tax=Candidatus Protofrankia californiensis TaxID=1839754 RepID=A0A1C3NTU9_9ACTN|nr:coenzyme F420-dependent N5 N10-methylene tetrahydromethanopterin reductase-like protein [Candidatus Protofrankia californiensis]
MDVSIGLPSTIPGAEGSQILEWAKRADRAAFLSLGVIDRLVYSNDEPLITLAAAAAATERIKLLTAIAILPYRVNAALFAKQAASIQHLSGNRLVLGLGLGGREDDYEAGGVPFAGRGRRFEKMLVDALGVWSGEPRGDAGAIGPTPPVRPGLLIGGQSPRSFQRAAEHADGWIAGGAPPEAFGPAAAQVKAAWEAHGRQGRPRLAALGYFSLGSEAHAHADSYLRHYYAFAGAYAEQVVAGALTDDKAVRDAVAAFAEAGCDELVLFPCNPEPGQVDLLADAIG